MKCEYCEYEGKDSEFLANSCPACCRDILTGEKVENAIPIVFHLNKKEDPMYLKVKRYVRIGGEYCIYCDSKYLKKSLFEQTLESGKWIRMVSCSDCGKSWDEVSHYVKKILFTLTGVDL